MQKKNLILQLYPLKIKYVFFQIVSTIPANQDEIKILLWKNSRFLIIWFLPVYFITFTEIIFLEIQQLIQIVIFWLHFD